MRAIAARIAGPDAAERLRRHRLRRAFRKDIRHVLRSDGPVLAGPWLGEVGFEILYWIPLLRWCVGEWPELAERLVVVSRGGVAGWYEGIAAQYLDLFQRYDERSFWRRLRAERRERRARGRGSSKQFDRSDWEREIEAWAADTLEEPVDVLHPSVMYRASKLVPVLADTDARAFPRWKRPARGPLDGALPDEYVAVRFYRNKMFGGDEAEVFIGEVTRALGERLPVVALNPGSRHDPKHPELQADGVISLAPHIPFAENLAYQSIAIANATAFVGTFGGLSFLAPNYGVSSVAFWSTTGHGDPETKKRSWRDLDIARRAYAQPWLGDYQASFFKDAPVEELLASISAGQERPGL